MTNTNTYEGETRMRQPVSKKLNRKIKQQIKENKVKHKNIPPTQDT